MSQWTYIQDLISAGLCSPQCLFGMKPEDSCQCRCKGESHGIAVRAIEAEAAGDPLVGKFFHSFQEHECGHRTVEWQGIVAGRIERGRYLVQLFDWIMGQPSVQIIVTWSQIKGFQFYRSAYEMTFEYEHRGLENASERHDKCSENAE